MSSPLPLRMRRAVARSCRSPPCHPLQQSASLDYPAPTCKQTDRKSQNDDGQKMQIDATLGSHHDRSEGHERAHRYSAHEKHERRGRGHADKTMRRPFDLEKYEEEHQAGGAREGREGGGQKCGECVTPRIPFPHADIVLCWRQSVLQASAKTQGEGTERGPGKHWRSFCTPLDRPIG